MAIQATTEWRIRAGGNAARGGGFDPNISGAGADYTDQDAAQLSLTDLATSGAGSTTLTSATGGFTAAMIGNCIRISTGTNFQAGHYFILGRTDTNTVTLDRTPTSAGAGSSGVGEIGGAFASFENLGGVGFSGLSSPSVTSPLAAGHTVWIRGAGSDDPGTNDFSWIGDSQGYWASNADGNGTDGRILIKGYNGRPRIQYSGLLWWKPTLWHVDNIKFFRNSATGWPSYGLFNNSQLNNNVTCSNLRFDMNGVDAVALVCAGMIDIYVGNSGGGVAGTKIALQPSDYACLVQGCVVEDVRGDGIGVGWVEMSMYLDCIAINCGRHGFYTESDITSYRQNFVNCVAYSCGSDGFHFKDSLSAANAYLRNCIAVDNGGYGYAIAAGSAALNDRLIRGQWDYNASRNNTSGARQNHSAGANDVTLSGDPFTNAASGDFSLDNVAGEGAACREAGWPGVFRGISTTGYRDIGAAETQDAGGGGGLLVHPGMTGGAGG